MAKVVIPIGPQHPALKEPASFILTLEGEKVVDLKAKLGYNHRGLEKACESRSYIQGLYLIERVCGICSHAHSTAYLQCVEDLAGAEIPRRAAYIRSLIGELERLHSHLLWLGVAAHEIGFDTFFMYVWRDRELILDLLAKICGNRINYGISTIGGVRRDIEPQHVEEIRAMLKIMNERLKYYTELALTDVTLGARLAGIGKLSREDSIKYGAIGPVARAAGIDWDVRVGDPYAAYDEIKVNVVTDEHADVYGRTLVRVGEMVESCRLIELILDNMPDGEITTRVPRKIPTGEAVSRYEAPRGEDMHYIKSNNTDIPERTKVRAPTEANWHGIEHMVEGDYLADAPIIIAAIDPCYSCTDRSIYVNDIATGENGKMSWQQLQKYSVDWHKENRGIDFNKIKLKEIL